MNKKICKIVLVPCTLLLILGPYTALGSAKSDIQKEIDNWKTYIAGLPAQPNKLLEKQDTFLRNIQAWFAIGIAGRANSANWDRYNELYFEARRYETLARQELTMAQLFLDKGMLGESREHLTDVAWYSRTRQSYDMAANEVWLGNLEKAQQIEYEAGKTVNHAVGFVGKVVNKVAEKTGNPAIATAGKVLEVEAVALNFALDWSFQDLPAATKNVIKDKAVDFFADAAAQEMGVDWGIGSMVASDFRLAADITGLQNEIRTPVNASQETLAFIEKELTNDPRLSRDTVVNVQKQLNGILMSPIIVSEGNNSPLINSTPPQQTKSIISQPQVPTPLPPAPPTPIPPVACIPNWQCNSWNICSNGQQTRTCTDSNNCGVSTNKPTVTQSCSQTTTPLEREAQKRQQEEALLRAQDEQRQAEEQRKARAATEEAKQREQPTNPFGLNMSDSITVISPQAGTIFSSPTAQIPFSWSWSGVTDTSIPAMYLLDQNGNVVYGELGTGSGWSYSTQSGSGLLPAPVHLAIPIGSGQYRIRICTSVKNTNCATGDYFIITRTTSSTLNPSASIHMATPKGGEILQAGSQYTIRWTNSGLPTNATQLIMIFNGTNGTISNPNYTIVSSLPPTTTSYTWTVTTNNGWGVGMGDGVGQKLADFLGIRTAFADTNQYVIGVIASVPETGDEIAVGTSAPFTINVTSLANTSQPQAPIQSSIVSNSDCGNTYISWPQNGNVYHFDPAVAQFNSNWGASSKEYPSGRYYYYSIGVPYTIKDPAAKYLVMFLTSIGMGKVYQGPGIGADIVPTGQCSGAVRLDDSYPEGKGYFIIAKKDDPNETDGAFNQKWANYITDGGTAPSSDYYISAVTLKWDGAQ
ncbi:MAG TPA: Ser-Thr-rich GPI-anchored membrane family protein [Candidatus Paceibacterota bacterium]